MLQQPAHIADLGKEGAALTQLLGLPGPQRDLDVSSGCDERLGERPGIERGLGRAGRRVRSAGDSSVPDEAGSARH